MPVLADFLSSEQQMTESELHNNLQTVSKKQASSRNKGS